MAECTKMYSDTLTAFGVGLHTERYSYDIDFDAIPDIEFVVTTELGHIHQSNTTAIKPLNDQWKIYSNEVIYPICQDTLTIPGNEPEVYYVTSNCENYQTPIREDSHYVANLHDSSDPENVLDSQIVNAEVLLHFHENIYHTTLFPNAEQLNIEKSVFQDNPEGWIIVENENSDQYGIKVNFDNVMKFIYVTQIKKLDCN